MNRKRLLFAAGLLIVVVAIGVAFALPSKQPPPCVDILNCKSGGGPTGTVADRRIPARLAIVSGGMIIGGVLAFAAVRGTPGAEQDSAENDPSDSR